MESTVDSRRRRPPGGRQLAYAGVVAVRRAAEAGVVEALAGERQRARVEGVGGEHVDLGVGRLGRLAHLARAGGGHLPDAAEPVDVVGVHFEVADVVPVLHEELGHRSAGLGYAADLAARRPVDRVGVQGEPAHPGEPLRQIRDRAPARRDAAHGAVGAPVDAGPVADEGGDVDLPGGQRRRRRHGGAVATEGREGGHDEGEVEDLSHVSSAMWRTLARWLAGDARRRPALTAPFLLP